MTIPRSLKMYLLIHKKLISQKKQKYLNQVPTKQQLPYPIPPNILIFLLIIKIKLNLNLVISKMSINPFNLRFKLGNTFINFWLYLFIYFHLFLFNFKKKFEPKGKYDGNSKNITPSQKNNPIVPVVKKDPKSDAYKIVKSEAVSFPKNISKPRPPISTIKPEKNPRSLVISNANKQQPVKQTNNNTKAINKRKPLDKVSLAEVKKFSKEYVLKLISNFILLKH